VPHKTFSQPETKVVTNHAVQLCNSRSNARSYNNISENNNFLGVFLLLFVKTLSVTLYRIMIKWPVTHTLESMWPKLKKHPDILQYLSQVSQYSSRDLKPEPMEYDVITRPRRSLTNVSYQNYNHSTTTPPTAPGIGIHCLVSSNMSWLSSPLPIACGQIK